MKRLTLILMTCALALAACASPATDVPPAPTRAPQPTAPLPTAPPPSPTTVPPTSTRPVPAASPVPSNTPAPASAPTTAPSDNPIAHLGAGTVISITDIHMLDANTGWAIGGLILGDHILSTKDGGKTWSDVTPPEPTAAPETPIRAVGYFMDANTAWVTYGNFNGGETTASVWRTADGGKTWQGSALLNWQDAGDYFDPTDIQFLDAQTGFTLVHLGVGMMHDYVSLYRTTDGGVNWERVVDPNLNNLTMSCYKSGLVFADAQHGIVTGDCQAVAPGVFLQVTNDGGVTWTTPDLPAPAAKPDLFTDQNVGCGTYNPALFGQTGALVVRCSFFTADPIRYESYLYTSADSGQTWALSATALPMGSASVTYLNATTAWAQSTADPNNPTAPLDIYQTLNTGATWTKVGTATWSGLFNFINDQTGWAVAQAGDSLALVSTINAGKKWSLLKPQIAP